MTAGPIRWVRFALAHRWTQRHLSEYIDDDLDQGELERAERHLRECPECHELLGSLRKLVAGLGYVGGEPRREVAPSVLAGVHERLEAAGDDDQPV